MVKNEAPCAGSGRFNILGLRPKKISTPKQVGVDTRNVKACTACGLQRYVVESRDSEFFVDAFEELLHRLVVVFDKLLAQQGAFLEKLVQTAEGNITTC